MRTIFKIILSISYLTSLVSCVKEAFHGGHVPDGEPVDLVFQFGAPAQGVIEPTKATLRLQQESTIYNLYVFIFDKADGQGKKKKIYGKYFDASNLIGHTSESEYWKVTNATENTETGGEVHLRTISRTGCTLVVISNIDAEMVNISPEQLSTIQDFSELYEKHASLNQLIVSRSGYFPMSGIITNLDTGYPDRSPAAKLTLRRLDAKIMFNVRVDDNNGDCKIADFIPHKWQIVNLPKSSWILERGNYNGGNFNQADLVDASGSSDDDYFNLPETNFETQKLSTPAKYYALKDGETVSTRRQIVTHGFSFYMMENRKAPGKAAVPASNWTYADREKQLANGDFQYAPERATYVIITGQLLMKNVSYQATPNTGSNSGATLCADVKYIIHLGDFGESEDPSSSTNPISVDEPSTNPKYGDFNVFRNHTYIYDIVIQDVNSIRVEVECNADDNPDNNTLEPAPGASGQLTVAMEDIFPCDAHYCSHVIPFHAKYIDPTEMTWRVQTPFNPSGASPVLTYDDQNNVTENITGVDCAWVEFRVNNMDDDGISYLANRRKYQPLGDHADGKTMNISELVDFLKKQKDLFDEDYAHIGDDSYVPQSQFDHFYTDANGTHNSQAEYYENATISVTAFVNEYYYETNPITHDYQPALWKKFVNAPMRYMYILSNTKLSADGHSEIIGSSFTIQQKSIQTIYNISHPELQSAWGCEHEDDDIEEGLHTYSPTKDGKNRGNNSLTNGRANSLKEWGLLSANSSSSILGDGAQREAYWEHYMDLEADNGTPTMLGPSEGDLGYRYLRYSCMSRNRDNNGNGVIDTDEVRWYMGATGQLIGLFLGDYGLEGDARLYQRSMEQQKSIVTTDWRQHVIASTRYTGSGSDGTSDNSPRVIWAEQGLTGSTLKGSKDHADNLQQFSTRCVRNLGAYTRPSDGKEEDITFAPVVVDNTHPEVVPDDYIVVSRLKDGVPYSGTYDTDVYYEFDCSRLNEKSLRYYTNRELAMHDEHSEQACLYRKFRAAPVKDTPSFSTAITCNAINEELDGTITSNRFCPPGYRLCNIREAAVIREFVPDNDNKKTYHVDYNITRTYWSFGLLGDMYDKRRKGTSMAKAYVFGTSTQKVLIAEKGGHATRSVRCVKDIKD